MAETLQIRTLTGATQSEQQHEQQHEAPAGTLDGVAGLRIAVFREWPYLYAGSMDYERRYLARTFGSRDAIVVGAFDGARLVGAATGTPMEDHMESFGAPLAARGHDPGQIFYFGESVLLPEYRGRGVGHAFFDAREAHARRLGRRFAAFCAIQRPADHPMRPEDYRPLDGFWRKRAYAPLQGVTASFAWTDLGDAAETKKPMQVWMRAL